MPGVEVPGVKVPGLFDRTLSRLPRMSHPQGSTTLRRRVAGILAMPAHIMSRRDTAAVEAWLQPCGGSQQKLGSSWSEVGKDGCPFRGKRAALAAGTAVFRDFQGMRIHRSRETFRYPRPRRRCSLPETWALLSSRRGTGLGKYQTLRPDAERPRNNEATSR